MEWLERGWHRELRERWDLRLRRLGATNQVTRDNDLLAPAVHPEAVALAGLLISPWWCSRLQHDSRTSSWPFLMEAGRRLGLRCYPAMSWSDPLLAWTRKHLVDLVEDQADDDPLAPLLHLPATLVLAERRARFSPN